MPNNPHHPAKITTDKLWCADVISISSTMSARYWFASSSSKEIATILSSIKWTTIERGELAINWFPPSPSLSLATGFFVSKDPLQAKICSRRFVDPKHWWIENLWSAESALASRSTTIQSSPASIPTSSSTVNEQEQHQAATRLRLNRSTPFTRLKHVRRLDALKMKTKNDTKLKKQPSGGVHCDDRLNQEEKIHCGLINSTAE